MTSPLPPVERKPPAAAFVYVYVYVSEAEKNPFPIPTSLGPCPCTKTPSGWFFPSNVESKDRAPLIAEMCEQRCNFYQECLMWAAHQVPQQRHGYIAGRFVNDPAFRKVMQRLRQQVLDTKSNDVL